MSTLDAKADLEIQPTTFESTPAPTVEQSTDTAALITEQQVLFGSAAALAPAPAKTYSWSRTAHAVAAMFARPEKQPRARKHYPKHYGYLENSLMSREMDRL